MTNPDADLDKMDCTALLAAARAMRAAMLPDPPKGQPVVPDWPQFLRGCIAYRTALDRELGDAPRTDREYGA